MKHWTLFGRPLGIGLILLQKTLWGSVLLVIAVVLLIFHAQHVTDPIQELFTRELAEDPHDLLATVLIRLIPTVSLQTELLLAVDRCLARAHGRVPDAVFLTGGSSKIPSVRQAFAERFGEGRLREGDAFTSVAAGLGRAAGLLASGGAAPGRGAVG